MIGTVAGRPTSPRCLPLWLASPLGGLRASQLVRRRNLSHGLDLVALLALPLTLPAVSDCGVSIALQPERRGGEA